MRKLENDPYNRRELSPAEFRERVTRFRALHPCWIESSFRSSNDNAAVGGNPASKHCYSPLEPIAADLIFADPPELGSPEAGELVHDAKTLGLFAEYHDTGSGPHMHAQAIPTGPPSAEWRRLYGGIE